MAECLRLLRRALGRGRTNRCRGSRYQGQRSRPRGRDWGPAATAAWPIGIGGPWDSGERK